LRRIVGALFVLVLAVSLVLVPASVSAASGIGDDCTYDKVKWEDNENSWILYLQHWGKTPLSAMSRLAGLCSPNALCKDVCNASGLCKGTRITGCDIPTCENACCCAGSESIGCCLDDEVCESCLERPPGGCCCCWGISLCFANKSWSAGDIGVHARINNEHPNHFGNSAAVGELANVGNPTWNSQHPNHFAFVTGDNANRGGDWGVSGCQHAECVSETWCLQMNCLSQDWHCAP